MNKILFALLMSLISVSYADEPKRLEKTNEKLQIDPAQPITQEYKEQKYIDAPKGIYVVTDFNTKPDEKIWTDPNVDGVFLQLGWNAIEPKDATFDYTLLDEVLIKAYSNKKKVSLAIVAGTHSPAWIYKKDVPMLSFEGTKPDGTCYTATMPLPYSRDFINAYADAVRNVGEHIKSTPTFDQTLSLVKLSGINIDSPELRLPEQTSTKDTQCKVTDAIALWKKHNFRPSKIQGAFEDMVKAYRNGFLNKYFSISLGHDGHDFPAIDEKGNVVSEQSIALMLLDTSKKNLGERLILQQNQLTGAMGTPQMLMDAKKRLNLPIAFQISEKDFGKACVKKECKQTAFNQTMDRAFENNSLYVEVFQPNLRSYPKSIAHGKQVLTGVK